MLSPITDGTQHAGREPAIDVALRAKSRRQFSTLGQFPFASTGAFNRNCGKAC
jgi:hypothetical protein